MNLKRCSYIWTTTQEILILTDTPYGEYLQMTNDSGKSLYAVKENIPEEEILDKLSEAVAACKCFQHQTKNAGKISTHMLTLQNQHPVKKSAETPMSMRKREKV